MQRIYFTALTPEQYVATEAHRQVIAELVCPRCGKGRLHRHGQYGRGITGMAGQLLGLCVARFLCLACGGTVSYLPSFALSYRLVQAATLLVVGGNDFELLALNRALLTRLNCTRRLEVVPGASRGYKEPGALDTMAHLACAWFETHLANGNR